MKWNASRKEGFSLLLVVLIAFVFLTIISISLWKASSTETRQLFANLEGDNARALAEAGLKAAMDTVLTQANTPGTEFFDWFRNAQSANPGVKQVDVKDAVLKLFPDPRDQKKIGLEKVEVSMEVSKPFKDLTKTDTEKLEKNGQVKFFAKASFGERKMSSPRVAKFEITAAYDFKVVLIMLPIIKDTKLDSGELNKFAFFVRKGSSFIDNMNYDTPEISFVYTNDELSSGLLHFGNKDGETRNILRPTDFDSADKPAGWRFENAEFKKFYRDRIFYNNPILSDMRKLEIAGKENDIPIDKVCRLFITSDSFFDFYMKNNILNLDGMSMVEAGLTLATPLKYKGYAMTICRNGAKLQKHLEKTEPESSAWFLFNPCKTSSEGDPNIYLENWGVSVNLCAPYGEIVPTHAERRINIGGSLSAFEIKRVSNGKNITGTMNLRDANILFPYSADKKKTAYSVSMSHALSYYRVQRKSGL
ncbi:MAG: hypothetical protein PHQ23_00425 [Candidatus Wallbacteria bacterium]|nr:hypothetical protein [Candidatus Wallbacteria bacterium]